MTENMVLDSLHFWKLYAEDRNNAALYDVCADALKWASILPADVLDVIFESMMPADIYPVARDIYAHFHGAVMRGAHPYRLSFIGLPEREVLLAESSNPLYILQQPAEDIEPPQEGQLTIPLIGKWVDATNKTLIRFFAAYHEPRNTFYWIYHRSEWKG